jgi:hypothetical protein
MTFFVITKNKFLWNDKEVNEELIVDKRASKKEK